MFPSKIFRSEQNIVDVDVKGMEGVWRLMKFIDKFTEYGLEIGSELEV
jgi:hypothetical protein